MSALLTLIDPVSLTALHGQVLGGDGILATLNDQTNQVGVLIKNVASVSVLIVFLYIAHQKRFAAGAVIGGLLACGLIFFAVNGGLAWIGSQFTTQVGTTAGLGALTWHSLI